MLKSTDRLFRKLFMGLVTMAIMLVFILSMNLLFQIPLNSKALWSGSILAYVAINLIFDIRGITRKIIILCISSITMGMFFSEILHWTLVTSLLTGTVILIISVLLYMTFLH